MQHAVKIHVRTAALGCPSKARQVPFAAITLMSDAAPKELHESEYLIVWRRISEYCSAPTQNFDLDS